jgi:UDP-N-acetylmuramyl tripeptide synthase
VFELPAGPRVLVDFAHNPDGVRQVLGLARALLGDGRGRLALVTGQAGDRRNEDLRALAAEIARAKPGLIVLWDIVTYLRGRAEGEVPAILRQALVAETIAPAQIALASSETEALSRALAWARAGDVVVLAPNIDRDHVTRRIVAEGGTTARHLAR